MVKIVKNEPLEGLDIVDGFADPEDHEQVVSDDGELYKGRVTIVFVKILKVRQECVAFEHVQRTLSEGTIFPLKHGKDIFQHCLGAQTDKDVVSENEMIADGNHVTRVAVIACGDAFAGQQLGIDCAKDILAQGVELFEPAQQVLALRLESMLNDLVGAALQLDFLSGLLGRFFFFISHNLCSFP